MSRVLQYFARQTPSRSPVPTPSPLPGPGRGLGFGGEQEGNKRGTRGVAPGTQGPPLLFPSCLMLIHEQFLLFYIISDANRVAH